MISSFRIVMALLLQVVEAIVLRLRWSLFERSRLLPLIKEPHEIERVGRTKIKGAVRGKELVQAPVSGEEVVAYQLLIEMELGEGNWQALKEVVEVKGFDVIGSTGAAVAVEADRLGMLLLKQRRSVFCGRAELSALFDLLGIPASEDEELIEYRITECRLANGAEVLLDGVIKNAPARAGDFAGFREAPAQRRIGSSDELDLILMDLDLNELSKRVVWLDKQRLYPPDLHQRMFEDHRELELGANAER